MKILHRILSMFGIMPSKARYEEWAERCGFVSTFVETRYPGHPVPVPAGDEKTFYYACGFCLQIDSDGMASLLGQPDSERQVMERSLQELGLKELLDLTTGASGALRQSSVTGTTRRPPCNQSVDGTV